MKKGVIIEIIIGIVILISLNFVSAWTHDVHIKFCPNAEIDCTIADSFDFQKDNPNAIIYNHVCYDNKEDCVTRLAAKYFLKKFYLGNKSDKSLLGASLHLYQDASCPQHWYPGFKILGREVYLFAPSWVKNVEGLVSIKLSTQENWSIPIKFREKIMDIDEEYLNNMEQRSIEFLSQEPEESLKEIESQINSKKIWHYLRAYQCFFIIFSIFFFFAILFESCKFRKSKKISIKLIIYSIAFFVILLTLIITKIFY